METETIPGLIPTHGGPSLPSVCAIGGASSEVPEVWGGVRAEEKSIGRTRQFSQHVPVTVMQQRLRRFSTDFCHISQTTSRIACGRIRHYAEHCGCAQSSGTHLRLLLRSKPCQRPSMRGLRVRKILRPASLRRGRMVGLRHMYKAD
jgi:hypothetical protein